MTRDDLKGMLERIRVPLLPPKLQGVSTRYRLQLDEGDTWDFLMDQGRLSLAEAGGSPDLVVECSTDECAALLSGRHNLLTAFMRGDARVRGPMLAAKNLHAFLRYAEYEEVQA